MNWLIIEAIPDTGLINNILTPSFTIRFLWLSPDQVTIWLNVNKTQIQVS